MRSPARAFKTDLQELLAYGPALLAGAVNYQLYKQREHSSCTTASNVVISLTSMPARLSKLHNCIRSLLAQRYRAEKVLLYLARDECRDVDVPDKLKQLQGAGLEIRYVDINVRSLNKIYHALADFPDKTIVTCDDDKLYPPGWQSSVFDRTRLLQALRFHALLLKLGMSGRLGKYSERQRSVHIRKLGIENPELLH